MSQKDAPLFEALKNYLRRGIIPFHTPGHRGGQSLRDFGEMARELLEFDLTEFSDLDGASTEVRRNEAQRLAAEFFGAETTHFLANGATEGVLALILAIGRPGDEIIVLRDCHISVIHGMILSGLRPVFVAPDWIPGWSLPCLPTPERIQSVLKAHPYAKAVWVTHPSYAGVTGELAPIAQVVHDAGLPLLVDEAHGGYLRWTGLSTAAEAKDLADAWVHGIHKIMGSLTQTGLLHLQGERIDHSRIAQTLAWVRSTSPSYLLLSSIDLVRRFMALNGVEYFERTAMAAARLRIKLEEDGICQLIPNPAKGFGLDPMKLVVSWLEQGWTGGEARQILSDLHRIQPEFFDRNHVGFFLSPMQHPRDFGLLRQAARYLVRHPHGPSLERVGPPPLQEGGLVYSPSEAVNAESEWIPYRRASGYIAAQSVAPYPPGMPIWCPGERITPDAIEWLQAFEAVGGGITGLNGDSVLVLKDSRASYGIE